MILHSKNHIVINALDLSSFYTTKIYSTILLKNRFEVRFLQLCNTI